MRSVASLLFLVACSGGGKPVTTTPDPVPVADPVKPTKPVKTMTLAEIGLDPAAIDRKADPCADFYQFACGSWVATTEIDADKPMASRSFIAIEDRNLDYERGVLDAARTPGPKMEGGGLAPTPGNDAMLAKLGAYYGSCMDEATIAKQGIKPIGALLAKIDKVRDAKSLSAAVATLHAAGFSVLFNFGSGQDAADATQVIGDLEQGGIGLPDRDYYLKDDAQTKVIRAAYENYVATMMTEMGRKTATKDAADIVALETAIAKVSKDKVALRDPKTMYNRLDRAGVTKAMKSFDWDNFWSTIGLKDIKSITVGSPDFLAGVDALITSTKPEVWRSYLTFHVANRASSYLTKKIEDTAFKFESALTGQPEQPPRWKRCVASTDAALGDLLGQVFVRDRFPGASKTAAEEQIHAIAGAMAANLQTLPWMDDVTKSRAKDKLTAMSYEIGYPDKWRTYDFKIDPATWGANALAARAARTLRDLTKIGKPVDKKDWPISAPTVNAGYEPSLNGMFFPAGILQKPFYSVDASIPVNLGAMGSVVGHELTHGFDDQGAQYDAVGNLKDWWQPETAKQFKAKTQCVVDQYSQYEVIDHTKLNGANTVGENIADIGGVKLALSAYRSLRASSPDTVVADGFTEDQQFFLAFGQAWCAKARPEFEKLLATIDVHSPGKWRVNGVVSDTPEFAKVWSCKAGAKMAPAKSCNVW